MFYALLKSSYIKDNKKVDINFEMNIGILGQVWFLIVSIPDLCTLTYFDERLCNQPTRSLDAVYRTFYESEYAAITTGS